MKSRARVIWLTLGQTTIWYVYIPSADTGELVWCWGSRGNVIQWNTRLNPTCLFAGVNTPKWGPLYRPTIGDFHRNQSHVVVFCFSLMLISDAWQRWNAVGILTSIDIELVVLLGGLVLLIPVLWQSLDPYVTWYYPEWITGQFVIIPIRS